MSDRIQYLDLPSIFGAIQQIRGGQQRSRLLELQMQEAQRKLDLEKTQGTTLSTLFGGADPATGINWSGGRPGLTPTEQNNMIASAFPKEFAEAKIKQLYPTPEKPFAVGNNVYDPQAKTFTQGPSNFSVAPLPGQAAPGDTLRTVAPQPQPGPGPTPQRPTIATGPGKTVEGEVPAIYAPHIADAAAVYGVDATVLGNMLLTETGPRGPLTSPKGARGVGQFMPGTAQQYNVDVNDPKSSIDGMGKMMQYLLKKYGGDYRLAVGAYDWGEGNVDQWIKDGGDPAKVPKETMEYVRKTVGLQTAGPNDQTGFDHPGTAKAGGATTQASGGNYPPGMVGFRKDNKTGEFVSGGKPGYGIGVNAQGQELGSFRLPGIPDEEGLKAQEVETKKSDTAFTNENTLRDEFNTLTKDYRSVTDAYRRIQGAAKSANGPGDMAMLYAYVRLLDPNTGVKEGEFQTAAASGSFGERVQGAVQKILTGGRLPDDLRSQFLKEADGLFAAQKKGFEGLSTRYRGIAKRRNLNPDNVVSDYGEGVDVAPPPATTTTAQAAPPVLAERVTGQTYQTPRGPAIWRGNGWELVK